MSKSYLYVGCYYDVNNRPIGIKDKKIGITKNPKERENSLNSTKGPIGYMFIKLYEFDGSDESSFVEDIFHTTLSDRNTNGEWFNDEDDFILDCVEEVISKLRKLGVDINDINLQQTDNLTPTEKVIVENANDRKKLHVTFKGNDITEKTSTETFINTIKLMSDIVGWDIIDGLNDNRIGDNYEEMKDRYGKNNNLSQIKEINGHYVWTGINTFTKHKILVNLTKGFELTDFNVELK